MATPLQGGWQSASPRSSERAFPIPKSLNFDCDIEFSRDDMTKGVEPQTTSSPPNPSPAEARAGLSDKESVHFNDQLLFDTEGPALLDQLTSTIPAVAEIVEGLAMEAWRALYPSFGYRDPNQSSLTTSPVRTPTLSTGSHRRYDFTCALCRRVHDRFNRARDCQYQDLGLAPYQCKGACSNADCHAAYNSEERLNRHLSSSVRCPFWYANESPTKEPTLISTSHKRISVQNAARHKTVYCLNRPIGPTVPESEGE